VSGRKPENAPSLAADDACILAWGRSVRRALRIAAGARCDHFSSSPPLWCTASTNVRPSAPWVRLQAIMDPAAEHGRFHRHKAATVSSSSDPNRSA